MSLRQNVQMANHRGVETEHRRLGVKPFSFASLCHESDYMHGQLCRWPMLCRIKLGLGLGTKTVHTASHDLWTFSPRENTLRNVECRIRPCILCGITGAECLTICWQQGTTVNVATLLFSKQQTTTLVTLQSILNSASFFHICYSANYTTYVVDIPHNIRTLAGLPQDILTSNDSLLRPFAPTQ